MVAWGFIQDSLILRKEAGAHNSCKVGMSLFRDGTLLQSLNRKSRLMHGAGIRMLV